MKTFEFPLPNKLHSEQGRKPQIEFSMSRRYYEINGKQYPNPLKDDLSKANFKGYMGSILKKTVRVTLFYSDDVIRKI